MADDSWKAKGVVASLALVGLVGIVWWAMPDPRSSTHSEPTGETIATRSVDGERMRRKIKRFAPEATAEDEPEGEIPLDEDPNIKVVTKNCRKIVTMQRKGVPPWSILDAIRDGSYIFNDDDIGCLSAAGARDSILRHAEIRYDYNWARKRALEEDQNR